MKHYEDYKNDTFYKYRSLKEFERFLDILVNKRLYGVTYKELNDPLEGKFCTAGLKEELFPKIYSALKRTRICSLMQKQKNQDFPDDFLMWSHYADSHTGCCIELKLTGSYNQNWEILKVKYGKELPKVTGANIKEDVSQILSIKTEIWDKENEVRAIREYAKEEYAKKSEFFHIKVQAVYLGRKIKLNQCKFYARIIHAIDHNIKVFRIVETKDSSDYYPKLGKIEI